MTQITSKNPLSTNGTTLLVRADRLAIQFYVDTVMFGQQARLRSDWQTLIQRLPDVPELTEDDILNEVKAVRAERRSRTKKQ